MTTVDTEKLASMLETQKTLVIDTMDASWTAGARSGRPRNNGSTDGTFTDAVQKRLEQKLRAWPTDRMPALEERSRFDLSSSSGAEQPSKARVAHIRFLPPELGIAFAQKTFHGTISLIAALQRD